MTQSKKIILVLIFAEIMFVVMGMAVKVAAHQGLNFYQIGFYRSVVAGLLISTVMLMKRESFKIHQPKFVIPRSIFASLAMMGNFYGITHLYLGDATMLMNTFPLYVAILGAIFLKHKLSKKLIILIIISWLGVLLIIKPEFGFKGGASVVVLLAALSASFDILLIHYCFKSDRALPISFYMVLTACLICFPFILNSEFPITLISVSAIIVAGIAGFLAQVSIIYAYGQGSISHLAPLAYLAVILSYLAGAMIWQEKPDLFTIIGSIIVITGCVFILREDKQDIEKIEKLEG